LTDVRGKPLGVPIEQLVAKYPRLYHMAEANSWACIRKFGLLSTSKLLDLCETPAPERERIEEHKRPNSVPLESKACGVIVIRDQKPLSESKLRACLRGCNTRTWLRTLNGRVFFWLTLDRLKTFMSARAYRNKIHTVLTVETEALVRTHIQRVTLSPMNSGSTSPFAHPRGLDTFKSLEDYPFAIRLQRGDNSCVIELAVDGGVPDIVKYILRATHSSCTDSQLRTSKILYEAAARH